jgi:hypothetical protein
MPETFTPKTWFDGAGGGTPITAAELNRVETGIESMDDRVTALEGSTGGGTITHNSQTGTTYTAVLGDAGVVVERTNAAANTHTVPPNSSVAFPTGSWHIVRQGGAGQTTIAPGSGVQFVTRFNPTPGTTTVKLSGQWAEATVTQRATNVWHIGGEITP